MKNPIFKDLGDSCEEFYKINGWTDRSPSVTDHYLTYLQTRLNTFLIYSNSETLCEQLGLNYADVLRETKFLADICGRFQIPGFQKTDSYQK